jgi:hypothetical protein
MFDNLRRIFEKLTLENNGKGKIARISIYSDFESSKNLEVEKMGKIRPSRSRYMLKIKIRKKSPSGMNHRGRI